MTVPRETSRPNKCANCGYPAEAGPFCCMCLHLDAADRLARARGIPHIDAAVTLWYLNRHRHPEAMADTARATFATTKKRK